MDDVYAKMVDVCERLLVLLSGKNPLIGEDHEAALEAIELLMVLEGWFRVSATQVPPVLQEEALQQLQHRARVLAYVQPVMALLAARGMLPTVTAAPLACE